MFSRRNDNLIEELKSQRRLALQSFDQVTLVKNQKLAEYFFSKFQEGKDVPFKLLQKIPVGEALLLPVVYGGAIITTKLEESSSTTATYNTKWTSGSTLTWHYHSDCNETIEVLCGRIKVYIEGSVHELSMGEKIEVAAGIGHQITALYESELKITFRKVF